MLDLQDRRHAATTTSTSPRPDARRPASWSTTRFRVDSICLANLQGAESIPAFIDHADRAHDYEFRVYEQLGRALPQAGAPEGRRRHLRRLRAPEPAPRAGAGDAGARDRDLREDRLRPAGAGRARRTTSRATAGRASSARPIPRAGNTRSRSSRPHWPSSRSAITRRRRRPRRRPTTSRPRSGTASWLAEFPNDPDAPQNNFLLAELLYESGQFAEPRPSNTRRRPTSYPTHRKSADAGYGALLALRGAAEGRQRRRSWCRCSARASTARCASPPRSRATRARRLGADQRRRHALRAARQRAAASVAQHVLDAQAAGRRRAAARRLDVVAYTSFEAGTLRPRREGLRRGDQARRRRTTRRAPS